MFDSFLGVVNSKLKNISSKLETYEGKLNEIGTDVSEVGISVSAVQNTSDEIKNLIMNEVQTYLSDMKSELLDTMNNSGGNYIVVPSNTVRSTITIKLNNYSSDMYFGETAVIIPYCGCVKIKMTNTRVTGRDLSENRHTCFAAFYQNGSTKTSLTETKCSFTYDNSVGYSKSPNVEQNVTIPNASQYIFGAYGHSYDSDSIVQTTVSICYDVVSV